MLRNVSKSEDEMNIQRRIKGGESKEARGEEELPRTCKTVRTNGKIIAAGTVNKSRVSV